MKEGEPARVTEASTSKAPVVEPPLHSKTGGNSILVSPRQVRNPMKFPETSLSPELRSFFPEGKSAAEINYKRSLGVRRQIAGRLCYGAHNLRFVLVY